MLRVDAPPYLSFVLTHTHPTSPQKRLQIELDKQIFKDELATAAAKHKEGANPKIIPLVSPPPSPSSTGGDSDVTATLFHYYDRRLPVRHQAVPKDASGVEFRDAVPCTPEEEKVCVV